MRNAFARELLACAERDPRIVLLAADIGNNLFNGFREHFADRFYNCGIAEAAMSGIAAGMALSGLRPVTYSIAAFNPGRCLEQVRVDLCLHNLPVVVVGVGAGLSYASLGPTHHALEDVAWMRALPNMTVLCPGDAVETRCALRAALSHDGPVYLRLGKKNEPVVHAREPDFVIGRWLRPRDGWQVTLLAAGTVLPVAMAAAEELAASGIECGVISMHTLKPLDEATLTACFGRSDLVMVLEEHGAYGGAWSAVAEWRAGHSRGKARLLRACAPDAFFTEGGGQNWARARMGLEADMVAGHVRGALHA